MTAYELVQSSRWDGAPAHYPHVHVRELPPGPARRWPKVRPSLCGIARVVSPVSWDVDPFHALADHVTCQRCRRMLERRHQ